MSKLSLGAPDILEETVALGESVQGVVALAHGTDEARESIDDVLTGNGPAVLVDFGDGDLARAVVLGLDDAVGGRALAGDVAVVGEKKLATRTGSTSLQTSIERKEIAYRSTISPRSFSIVAACDECC